MSDNCPVCGWKWGDNDSGTACLRCGRPPADEYDTGLDAVPEPAAPDLEAGLGDGPIRLTTRKTEERLNEAGYLVSNVGVETVPRVGWNGHHSAITDTDLFEYLLHDSLKAHLVTYREIYGFESTGVLLEAGKTKNLMTCPQKVANSWFWLTDQDPPTTQKQVRRQSVFFMTPNTAADRGDHPDPGSTSQADVTSFE